MILKILTITAILLIFIGGYFVYSNFIMDEKNKEEKVLFQGPVRPTDDEEHFRRTGETKPLEE